MLHLDDELTEKLRHYIFIYFKMMKVDDLRSKISLKSPFLCEHMGEEEIEES